MDTVQETVDKLCLDLRKIASQSPACISLFLQTLTLPRAPQFPSWIRLPLATTWSTVP